MGVIVVGTPIKVEVGAFFRLLSLVYGDYSVVLLYRVLFQSLFTLFRYKIPRKRRLIILIITESLTALTHPVFTRHYLRNFLLTFIRAFPEQSRQFRVAHE